MKIIRPLMIINLCVLALWFTGSPSFAQCESQFLEPEPYFGLNYGYSIAMDGDRAVVGARFDSTEGSRAGAAYILEYVGDRWVEVARLTAPDAEADHFFGTDVAISGDTIAVSADGDDDEGDRSGAVYIFREMSGVWFPEDKILGSDTTLEDRFGNAIALDVKVGDRVLFGKYAGQTVKVDGQEVLVMREEDIMAVVAK